jgi:hypothetical protein
MEDQLVISNIISAIDSLRFRRQLLLQYLFLKILGRPENILFPQRHRPSAWTFPISAAL